MFSIAERKKKKKKSGAFAYFESFDRLDTLCKITIVCWFSGYASEDSAMVTKYDKM